MRYQWVRKPAWLGLGLSATVAIGLSGCGGETADKSDAVLVNAPDAKTSANTSARSGSGGAKTSTESAADKSPSTATAAPVKSEGWGTLKGQVVFGGAPPQPAVLEAVGKAQKDPEICAKTTPIVDEKLVVNSGNKGVKNVFVYLQRPTAVNEEAKKAALAEKRDFDQKNCTYTPHALGVMTGETVTIKSSDPTNHNVNFSGLKNLSLNPLIAPGATMPVTPDSAERQPGPVTCSIHPWMKSYWMVLDHPYFAVTDENGNFEIKNAPAGTQKVVVWQEAVGGGYITPSSGQAVNITANGTTTQNFTIDPAKVQ